MKRKIKYCYRYEFILTFSINIQTNKYISFLFSTMSFHVGLDTRYSKKISIGKPSPFLLAIFTCNCVEFCTQFRLSTTFVLFYNILWQYLRSHFFQADALTFHGLATVCKQFIMQKDKHKLLFTSVIIGLESIYQRCLVGKNFKHAFSMPRTTSPAVVVCHRPNASTKSPDPLRYMTVTLKKTCFRFWESHQTEYTDFTI